MHGSRQSWSNFGQLRVLVHNDNVGMHTVLYALGSQQSRALNRI